MAYPSSYNILIYDWLNNPSTLKKSDPFLSMPNTGLLNQNYFDTMPEPILGDIDNNIAVLLNLNPGYTGEDNRKGYQPDNVVLSRNQMKPLINPNYETYAKPFPHLCAYPHHKAAADWWLKRQKWLENLAYLYNGYKATYSGGFPTLKPVALEICPYHSKEWSEAKIVKFNQNQKKWIEDNPFAVAAHALRNSILPFIISIGKPVYDAALQLGFSEVIKWSSSEDCALWPKNKNNDDIKKTFVVLEKNIKSGAVLKMLNIWSMFQKTPSENFDPVLQELFKIL